MVSAAPENLRRRKESGSPCRTDSSHGCDIDVITRANSEYIAVLCRRCHQLHSTIYDVAERAGVSAKTVSRVINNSPLVAPDTRRRVLAAIAELDFHPDSAAKGLRQRSRKSVGFVIPYGSDFVFQDQGMWMQTNGAHRALAERGYDLVLAVPETPELVLAELNRLTRNRTVDGVILYAMEGADVLLREFDRLNTRYMSLSMCYPGQKNNFVDMDSPHTAHLATKYMIDQGARRIGLIREPERFFYSAKAGSEPGYRLAHEQAGLAVDESLILAGDYSIESGYEMAKRLLASKPAVDGVICVSDPMTLGALRAMREKGLVPGRDIDVIAGDDFPTTRAMWPGLTSIRTPLTTGLPSGHDDCRPHTVGQGNPGSCFGRADRSRVSAVPQWDKGGLG